MRLLTYLVLGFAALVVIAWSVANRGAVTVASAPDLTAYGLPASPTYDVPLFALALGFGAVGFILGAAREYLREGRVRRRAAESRLEADKLQREVATLKRNQNLDEDDEIIALTAR